MFPPWAPFLAASGETSRCCAERVPLRDAHENREAAPQCEKISPVSLAPQGEVAEWLKAAPC